MPTSQAQFAWPLQKPQQLVYIELGADNGGMMLGICELGLSFRAVSPLKTDGPIHFTFALDGKTRLQGTGEIAWSEEGGKTGGLRFTGVSPQFRESLREWLASESTPKTVGREVTPAVALPLDSLVVPKQDVPSTFVEEAEPTAPPRAPEAKPAVPKPVVLVAAKPVVSAPVESKLPEAKPVELIQPRQPVHEMEPQVPRAAPPPMPAIHTPAERRPPETKPHEIKYVEYVQPGDLLRELEARVPRSTTSFAPPPKTELKPAEAKSELPTVVLPKLDPPKQIEPPSIEPIVAEPELRTVAPLPPADASSEPVFSLPNFRLPSADVPHLPMEEIVAKTAPIETPPAISPPLETSPPKPAANFHEVVSHEIEAPTFPRNRAPREIFDEDFVAESPRLNRAAAAGIIGLALGVILTALVFSFRREAGEVLIRFGQTLAGEEPKPTAAQQPLSVAAPVQNPSQSPQQAVQPPKTGDQPSAQATGKSSGAQQPSGGSPTQTVNVTSANVLPSDSATPNGVQRIQDLPPAPDAGTGEKEFQQARSILKGNHRQRDLSLAVRLLWIGVRKGHVPAEVTLADLYARGDGVARSCEQARVLLEAGVQKGSPEARRRLALLKQQGCS